MSERERYDLSEALNHIDPRDLNYQEWLEVGMALKHEGFPAEAWDEWTPAGRGPLPPRRMPEEVERLHRQRPARHRRHTGAAGPFAGLAAAPPGG